MPFSGVRGSDLRTSQTSSEPTPIAKKSVKPKLPSQAAVKGSLSGLVMCLKCATGPASIAKPSMNSRLPMLNATANLRGFTASNGKVRKATRKHTAAPAQQSRKPRNRSQRLRAANQQGSGSWHAESRNRDSRQRKVGLFLVCTLIRPQWDIAGQTQRARQAGKWIAGSVCCR